MEKRKTPQEKKVLDYINQTKNGYGENDKSSRKAIRERKALVNREFRRNSKQILNNEDGDWEKMDIEVSQQNRTDWKKAADNSLLEHLSDFGRYAPESPLQKEALKRLKKRDKLTVFE